MGVYLERFSRVKALKQGGEIHDLVRYQRDWLEDVRPDTVQRYRDLPHAIRNVARLAATEGIDAYIIRGKKHRMARGLATVVADQTVIHPDPEIGVVKGDDLDYWLRSYESNDFHAAVARSLVYASAKPHLGFIDNGPDNIGMGALLDKQGYHRAFATVPADQGDHLPLGLMGRQVASPPHMYARGEPAALSMPEGQEDRFGVTRGGAVVQLYYKEGVAVEQPGL